VEPGDASIEGMRARFGQDTDCGKTSIDKTSRGITPANKNERKEHMCVKENKRWTPAKMLPPL
jgi:hypothetical protein